MKIYIASSWKNQHAVEMLTDILVDKGHEVLCFVRHSLQERDFPDFEEWVNTDRAHQCFIYDTEGATKSDLVVYIERPRSVYRAFRDRCVGRGWCGVGFRRSRNRPPCKG